MVQLEITITSWYSLEGDFENYHVDYLVDGGKVDYIKTDFPVRRFAGTFFSVREIVGYFLAEYDFSGESKPEVYVDLWEGFHPLGKCSKGCLHARYTKKPEESLLDGLREIL